nr:unnamed protein product [Callosobruchus chinensis]
MQSREGQFDSSVTRS